MEYSPPPILFNAHLETIYPALFRKVVLPPFQRERITTPDDDFLDLDWLTTDSSDLVIISHGLEGNTTRAYIKGMAKVSNLNNFNVVAWNFRGCSGEMNRRLHFYHSGATHDLETVVQHALSKGRFQRIYLVGFSLGGNLTLKYLGEGRTIPTEVTKAVAFSVPMELETTCEKISSRSNWIYSARFLKSLKSKVVEKGKIMKELDTRGLYHIKTLTEFDNQFTAPLHGFIDAHDYYQQSSSRQFLQNIHVPTLIVNAKNDPFLSKECFPSKELNGHSFVKLETPSRGGHVGFVQFAKNGLYWSEWRAMDFLLE